MNGIQRHQCLFLFRSDFFFVFLDINCIIGIPLCFRPLTKWRESGQDAKAGRESSQQRERKKMSTSVVARSKKRKRTAQLQTRLNGGYWRRNAAQMDDALTTPSKAATSKRTRKVKVIVTSEVPHLICAHPFCDTFYCPLINGFD
jgi:hypothetical protein